jgi:hypothetical protein
MGHKGGSQDSRQSAAGSRQFGVFGTSQPNWQVVTIAVHEPDFIGVESLKVDTDPDTYHDADK